MPKFDIDTIDADGTTEKVTDVGNDFLKTFFDYMLEDADQLEVGGIVIIKVVG